MKRILCLFLGHKKPTSGGKAWTLLWARTDQGDLTVDVCQRCASVLGTFSEHNA